MKFHSTIFLATAAMLATGVSYAQSAVQCERTADGSYRASLIWQNTLGAARADGICNAYAREKMALAAPPEAKRGDVAHGMGPDEHDFKKGSAVPVAPPRASRIDDATWRKAYASVAMGQTGQGNQEVATHGMGHQTKSTTPTDYEPLF